jgi:hypothetical protein
VGCLGVDGRRAAHRDHTLNGDRGRVADRSRRSPPEAEVLGTATRSCPSRPTRCVGGGWSYRSDAEPPRRSGRLGRPFPSLFALLVAAQLVALVLVVDDDQASPLRRLRGNGCVGVGVVDLVLSDQAQSTGSVGCVVTVRPALGLRFPPGAAAATVLAAGRWPGGAHGEPEDSGHGRSTTINRRIAPWSGSWVWMLTTRSTSTRGPQVMAALELPNGSQDRSRIHGVVEPDTTSSCRLLSSSSPYPPRPRAAQRSALKT